MGITATAGAKAFSHTITWGITLATTTNLAQYVYWKSAARSGTHFERYTPVYLLLAAIPLVMADLTRHVLMDAGVWTGDSARMYRDDCGPLHGLHGILCLSTTGWLFTIVFTYSGFIAMVTGVLWSANIHHTIRKFWGEA